MAKRQDNRRAETAAIHIPIEWMPSEQNSIFANNMLVQASEHECHLLFYEITPPLIQGDDEELRRKQVEQISSIKGRCVAKIVISAERIETFAQTLMKIASERRNGKSRVS